VPEKREGRKGGPEVHGGRGRTMLEVKRGPAPMKAIRKGLFQRERRTTAGEREKHDRKRGSRKRKGWKI